MSNYTKLKTNLKLAIQRLKLLEKKKTELSHKSRKEIADYIQINKADRARIRVEHIIREDNYVEAMEMLEMFCDLLLARFGLIEKMKELDPGLDEAIATVLWASPRISNDIQEFKLIGDIFTQKYGKKYAEACKADTLTNVNEKVKKRLGLEPPPKLLVEQYLIEIAKNFNIPYEPDQSVMLRSGYLDEELISLKDKTNEITRKYGGDNNSGNNGSSGGGGGGSGAAIGFDPNITRSLGIDNEKSGFNDLIDLNDENNNNLNPINEKKAPELPKNLPFGDVRPPPYNNTLFNFGDLNNVTPNNNSFNDQSNLTSSYHKSAPPENEVFNNEAPPLPGKNPNYFHNQQNDYMSPPGYYDGSAQFSSPPPSFKTKQAENEDFELDLPSIPNSHPTHSNDQSSSIDFDDLTKRFMNLKSKK